MNMKQIYSVVNTIVTEVLGTSAVVSEDLSNIVDIGTQIQSLSDWKEKYGNVLPNVIGKYVFENYKYNGGAPKLYMDSWEYGSIMAKVNFEMPTVVENKQWYPTNGTDYSAEEHTFVKSVGYTMKCYNDRTTFRIKSSFYDKQLKQSFHSAEEMARFIEGLEMAIENKMTVAIDSLIMRTINNFVLEIGKGNSTVQKRNLLNEYNTLYSQALTASESIYDKYFLQYAVAEIGKVQDRMKLMSTLFNAGGKERFTTDDRRHTVCLTDFDKNAQFFLNSDTYHKEDVQLPNHDNVPYWQGSGTSFAFADVSKVMGKPSSQAGTGNDVTVTGLLAIVFDRDAMGVTNYAREITSTYTASAGFHTNYYDDECGYFNDLNENFVMFYVA